MAAALGAQIQAACGQLPPVVNAFADMLSVTHDQYRRQMDFVRRDLEALDALGRQAEQAVEAQSRKALSDMTAGLQTLAATMRQQAEAAVHNVPCPKEALQSQDVRTRLGRNITGVARVAGYREFDARIRSLAMELNSARSVLLSQMDQLRAEAQAHLEELTLNLGPELLPVWLRESSVGCLEKPLEFSLDPGAAFPDQVTQAAAQVRQTIPEIEFTSGWASRLEGLFKNELLSAATAGWTPAALDQAAAAAIAQIWTGAAERSCGILIGRLHVIVQVVTAGLESSRMASLHVPMDEKNRARLADAYRGFAAQLNDMRQHYASLGVKT
jgi:hypothetical protein